MTDALAAAGSAAEDVTITPTPSFDACVWNIQFGADSGTGRNRWPARRDQVAAALAARVPDLFAAQEVLSDQLAFLAALLPSHDLSAAAREDGVCGGRGEHCPIFYRRDRFALHEAGHFWLSPTPERPSANWDGRLPRICTWVRLHDRRARRDLVWLNTHFPHDTRSRQRSGTLLLSQLRALAGNAPAVLSGDLNSRPSSLVWRALRDGGLRHAESLARGRRSRSRTLHFAGIPLACIDAVFCTPHWRVLDFDVDRTRRGRRWPSDHFPLRCSLALE